MKKREFDVNEEVDHNVVMDATVRGIVTDMLRENQMMRADTYMTPAGPLTVCIALHTASNLLVEAVKEAVKGLEDMA